VQRRRERRCRERKRWADEVSEALGDLPTFDDAGLEYAEDIIAGAPPHLRGEMARNASEQERRQELGIVEDDDPAP
jgi:hypothetical protein